MEQKAQASNPEDDSLPEARVTKSHISWLLWIIPIAAVAFCGWLFYRDYVQKGPTVQIRFTQADGLEPGDTPVEYRGAKVGKVTKVHLTKDEKAVDVTVELKREAKDLARKGALFWIVKPEVKVGSVQALRTIVSGNYVTVRPGTGPYADKFVGADQAPPTNDPKAGLHIALLAPNLSSLQVESPIFYKGIRVGEILSYEMANDAQNIVLHARILPDYQPLVRRNSRFWNAGGVHVSLSLLRGAEISAESPQAILSGAVEFGTPPQMEEPASDGMSFRLYEKPEEQWKNWSPAIPLHLTPKDPNAVQPTHLTLK